jgi:N-acetyl-anhydromuramyl-L-alanine amidase AmpD
MRNSFLILSALLISSNAIAFQGVDPIIIIKKFITYNKKQQELSLEYLKLRYGLNKSTPTIEPKIIVLHYTAGGTLESNFRYFDKTEIEESRTVISGQSNLNVSSHYLIDRDGRIYQLMDDQMFTRHVIGLNYCAIGIENVGRKEAPLTEMQVLAKIME